MRSAVLIAALAFCAALTGCVMFQVGVTNPVAGLTTVAVAPFFNLSGERAVDGRRFAAAYYTELQKTPGFQVIPVGVVERALYDNRLEMNNADDVLRLAEILGVDAVVVGAITDYSPYYPPRIGLQVSWYSPRAWAFVPGMPLDETARKAITRQRRAKRVRKSEEISPEQCEPTPVQLSAPTIRGQSPEPRGGWRTLFAVRRASRWGDSPQVDSGFPVTETNLVLPDESQFNPRTPLMSYTRLFDGADPKLTARLRDYVELSGDLRSGGWEGYLHRSEDFIRFTSHLMVVEMLQLHGGEAQHRIVIKKRKHM